MHWLALSLHCCRTMWMAASTMCFLKPHPQAPQFLCLKNSSSPSSSWLLPRVTVKNYWSAGSFLCITLHEVLCADHLWLRVCCETDTSKGCMHNVLKIDFFFRLFVVVFLQMPLCTLNRSCQLEESDYIQLLSETPKAYVTHNPICSDSSFHQWICQWFTHLPARCFYY